VFASVEIRRELPVDFAIHHAAISAIDMAESIAFYEQFGFRVVLHWKDPDGELEIAHLKLGATTWRSSGIGIRHPRPRLRHL
jgi:catechol 2,3-dioxygenase-like lactoylglutathione lyase family enzyme